MILAVPALAAVACTPPQRPVALSVPPAPVASAAPVAIEPAPATAPPVPAGYVTMTVLGVTPQGAGGVIALVDPAGERVLPIYVGGTEAASAGHRFAGTRSDRPLTHDLLDALLRELGAELVRAQVDALENGTFIGSVVFEQKGRFIELDARPSDAVALAMGAKAPIVVAGAVLEKAGVAKADFDAGGDPLSAVQMLPPAAGPVECVKARLLKRLGRPEWVQAAASCVAQGGTP